MCICMCRYLWMSRRMHQNVFICACLCAHTFECLHESMCLVTCMRFCNNLLGLNTFIFSRHRNTSITWSGNWICVIVWYFLANSEGYTLFSVSCFVSVSASTCSCACTTLCNAFQSFGLHEHHVSLRNDEVIWPWTLYSKSLIVFSRRNLLRFA